MSKVARIITKIHRVCAGLLLLTMVPAAYASIVLKDPESPLVYLPLPFLFVLILTGAYQLVAPWVRRARARQAGGPA